MKERTSATIDIKRNNSIVSTVLISPQCVRIFRLMESDCIKLVFDSDAPIRFCIGDYIDDVIFGRFMLTKAQKPDYNNSNGAYHYELQFDAPYYQWKNWLFMLTVPIVRRPRLRREASWTLTNKLSEHLNEIINNLNILGEQYTYQIHPTASFANEVHTLKYDGQSIFDALNSMADDYETEWWVDGSVIHFGKCEAGDDPIEFEIGANVESMKINDNRNKFSNRIYAFGSSENLPYSYRKKFQMRIMEKDADDLVYGDRELTPDMFPNEESADNFMLSCGNIIGGRKNERLYEFSNQSQGGFMLENAKKFTIKVPRTTIGLGTLRSLLPESGGLDSVIRIRYTLNIVTSSGLSILQLASAIAEQTMQTSDTSLKLDDLIVNSETYEDVDLAQGSYDLKLTVSVSIIGRKITGLSAPVIQMESTIPNAVNFESSPNLSSAEIPVTSISGIAARNVYMIINPFKKQLYEDGEKQKQYFGIKFFQDGRPMSISIGSTIELPNSECALVPSAYFVTEYENPSSLASIGDNLLRMPTDTGDWIGNSDARQMVEELVIFKGIRPDCKLTVTKIEKKEMHNYVEYEGEKTKTDWQWEEYTLTLNQSNGRSFSFRKDYILPNTELRVQFLNGSLMGMEFGVQYNTASNTFTIVRNENYGTLLPSEYLAPKVGDTLSLLGWNVNALKGSGLIEDAERRLEAKAREYLAAIEEEQFTFDCNMMSGFMFDLCPYIQLRTRLAEDVKDSNALYIKVRNGYTNYIIPTAGAKIRIIHGALSAPKVSRVIGYELKLDKPYDSPRYTVGETQAYSRLAQIEKEIADGTTRVHIVPVDADPITPDEPDTPTQEESEYGWIDSNNVIGVKDSVTGSCTLKYVDESGNAIRGIIEIATL